VSAYLKGCRWLGVGGRYSGGGWRGIELDVRRAAVRRICQSPAFLVLFCVGGNNLYIQILKRLRGWW